MPTQAQTLGVVSGTILSLIAWILTAVVTIFYSSIGIFIVFPLTFLFDRNLTCMHWISRQWGKTLLAVSPIWSLKVNGTENLKPGQNYVITGNHQSLLDILVVLAGLPLHFKFMAKKELFIIPFLGWHMALSGYIPIDRFGSLEARKDAFSTAKDKLRKGVSVLFFPEGTRSLDGQIHDFKGGAFRAAADEKIPVLPVVIDGTLDAIPKKSWRLHKKTQFTVSILPPVKLDPENLKPETAAIRQKMIQALEKARTAK